jgi:hypothetical protein
VKFVGEAIANAGAITQDIDGIGVALSRGL